MRAASVAQRGLDDVGRVQALVRPHRIGRRRDERRLFIAAEGLLVPSSPENTANNAQVGSPSCVLDVIKVVGDLSLGEAFRRLPNVPF